MRLLRSTSVSQRFRERRAGGVRRARARGPAPRLRRRTDQRLPENGRRRHDGAMSLPRTAAALAALPSLALLVASARPETLPSSASADLPRAFVDGAGWTELSLDDFVNVNGDDTTWREEEGVIACTGKPIGGARTEDTYGNFEMVLEWRHSTHAGNSGVFLWCPESAFTDLEPGQLPRSGIEVQVLDLGYEENWEKNKGVPSNWFTSHGDVFPVGASKMTAFTPEITYERASGSYVVGKPQSARSFPSRRLTREAGQWNHYYIRAINGEVRLWVNGEEVNGGRDCSPAEGYLALEAEGAEVSFRNIRVRRLP